MPSIVKGQARRVKKAKRRSRRGTLSTARAIRVNELRAQAIELRLAGWPFITIANELGVSSTRAFDLVEEAMAQRVMPGVEALRKEMLEQLDAMMTGVWNGATSGDTNAIAAALAIQARKAKLTGADAPIRIQTKSEVDLSVSGQVDHVHTGALRIVFVKPDGREIEGTLAPPRPANGGNGHGQ